MDVKKTKREIKKTYLNEYVNDIEKEYFFKSVKNTLEKTAVGTVYTAITIGLTMAGLGFMGDGYLAAAEIASKGFFVALGATVVSVASLCGLVESGRAVAKTKMNKDLKNGTLMTRYQNEVIPEKKKALRVEASVAVKAFNEKKETRKAAMNELNEITTLTTEDFKANFNQKSIHARAKRVMNKVFFIDTFKHKGA